jgi:riboflavin synthase
MFTGIVSDIGEIVAAHDGNDLRRLAIRSAYPAAGIEIGASIACAGICLTAVAAGKPASVRSSRSTSVPRP